MSEVLDAVAPLGLDQHDSEKIFILRSADGYVAGETDWSFCNAFYSPESALRWLSGRLVPEQWTVEQTTVAERLAEIRIRTSAGWGDSDGIYFPEDGSKVYI